MALRLAVGAVCISVLLAAASAGSAGDAATSAGPGVVFTVFERLPPDGACPGLYAVDQQTKKISWLGGWDLRRDDSAVYPAFTAGATFSFGHWVDPSSSGLPLVNVYAGDRVVAQALAQYGWAWSPRREEVAYTRVTGRRAELVLGTVSGTTRVLARSASYGVSWLPDGSGLVHGSIAGSNGGITFVRRDGRGRRVLSKSGAAPVVSPDGRRVAFMRSSGIRTLELWVVGVRGGPARKVLSTKLAEGLRPMLWLSNRELLVQRGGERDPFFDARDTINRVNVDTRKERVFVRRGLALALSPDRKRMLFVRKHGDGEGYFSIRTVNTAGRDDQLLAVTDEEDMNVRSLPVWKPAGVELGPVGDPNPNAPSEEACVARLTALRARTP